jgi:hypothetical protein
MAGNRCPLFVLSSTGRFLHSAAIWDSFCHAGQAAADKIRDFCKSQESCVLAVGQMKKPCEIAGTFGNGFVWISEDTAQNKTFCSVKSTSLYWNKTTPVKNLKGEEARTEGHCTPENVRMLISKPNIAGLKDFFDLKPNLIISVSSRAMLMFAKDASLADMWQSEMKRLEGSDRRYSDSEWNSLSKQTDVYYALLKDYMGAFNK